MAHKVNLGVPHQVCLQRGRVCVFSLPLDLRAAFHDGILPGLLLLRRPLLGGLALLKLDLGGVRDEGACATKEEGEDDEGRERYERMRNRV